MKFASLIFLLFFPQLLFGEVSIKGHHRGLFSEYFDPIGTENHLSLNQLMLNSRMEIFYEKNDFHQIELAYELFASFNDFRSSLFKSDLDTERFNYRLDDLNKFLIRKDLYHDHSWQVIQNLDRLNYRYSGENTDFILGRQIISFGSARTVNPTDILVPFDFLVIDMEQRSGVDALNMKYSLGELSELDAGIVLGKNLKDENSASFLSYKLNFNETDYGFMAMRFKKHFLLGLDLQGQIGGIGVWLEAAYVDLKREEDPNYLRASIGGQYLFFDELSVFGEYHYNGAGTGNEKNYLEVASSKAFSEAGVYLLGRNYFNFGGSYPVNPLLGISLSFMNNLDDQSSLIVSKVEWNLIEDYFLNFGGFYGVGKKSASNLDLKSEFGYYPRSLYLILKYFY